MMSVLLTTSPTVIDWYYPPCKQCGTPSTTWRWARILLGCAVLNDMLGSVQAKPSTPTSFNQKLLTFSFRRPRPDFS